MSTGQQPGIKSAPRPGALRPGDKPLINRSLFSSIGLNGISFVRASGETFRRRVFDALGGARDACLLGKLFCRRPVLLGPAPPPGRAPRPDLLVVCPGFGFDRFLTNYACMLNFGLIASCRRQLFFAPCMANASLYKADSCYPRKHRASFILAFPEETLHETFTGTRKRRYTR